MLDPKEIQELLKRYCEGKASIYEQQIIEEWLEENDIENNSWLQMQDYDKEDLIKDTEDSLLKYINKQDVADSINIKQGATWYKRPRFYFAAASVIILIGISTWYFDSKQTPTLVIAKKEKKVTDNNIVPGSNKAVLTLADGGKVELNEDYNGVINEGNTEIKKNGNELVYNQAQNVTIKMERFNVLTTPRGGQYNLVLPDGTQVWLNAESSIKYPVAFKPEMRTVEIKGEVYFEVAAMANNGTKTPFQVKVFSENGEQKELVEVLGTHFNINAYSEEATVNTTLLEGRVKVNSVTNAEKSAILSVAQQAQLSNKGGRINVVNNVNVEEVVAWKNGLFTMKKADIPVVLRQLARWYDVDIVYTHEEPRGKITGDIPRSMPLKEVLKVMELSGVKCKIENRKIIVEN